MFHMHNSHLKKIRFGPQHILAIRLLSVMFIGESLFYVLYYSYGNLGGENYSVTYSPKYSSKSCNVFSFFHITLPFFRRKFNWTIKNPILIFWPVPFLFWYYGRFRVLTSKLLVTALISSHPHLKSWFIHVFGL